MNAKEEFLREVKEYGLPVCAKIGIEHNWGSNVDYKVLKHNYIEEEYNEFLESINVTYDSGYGTQECFGVILFKDSYSDRYEYDGSEYWDNHKMPTIEEVEYVKPKKQED